MYRGRRAGKEGCAAVESASCTTVEPRGVASRQQLFDSLHELHGRSLYRLARDEYIDESSEAIPIVPGRRACALFTLQGRLRNTPPPLPLHSLPLSLRNPTGRRKRSRRPFGDQMP